MTQSRPSPEARAVRMRIGGASYERIARALDVTPARAQSIVARELRKYREDSPEAARALELQRLDVMLGGLMKGMAKGDTTANAQAMAILKRRAELLEPRAADDDEREDGEGTGAYLARIRAQAEHTGPRATVTPLKDGDENDD